LTDVAAWRRCSACKKPLPFAAPYWACNVSTCNRARTALAFCSVECWEVHLPTAKHREAWAVERRAPAAASAQGGVRRLVRPAPPAAPSKPAVPKEVLIIASRLKDYVRARSGMNTSDRVLEPLSEIVRKVCEEAIANATRDGRRTLLDRDIPDV
jgi:hypothetical protein